jgi:hypothetical protein
MGRLRTAEKKQLLKGKVVLAPGSIAGVDRSGRNPT